MPVKPVPLDVPRAVAILEYAIKAAVGHASVPKGGDTKYMSGPWYKSRGGKRIGEMMKKKKKHGALPAPSAARPHAGGAFAGKRQKRHAAP